MRNSIKFLIDYHEPILLFFASIALYYSSLIFYNAFAEEVVKLVSFIFFLSSIIMSVVVFTENGDD